MVFDQNKKDGNANYKFRTQKKNRKKIRENIGACQKKT